MTAHRLVVGLVKDVGSCHRLREVRLCPISDGLCFHWRLPVSRSNCDCSDVTMPLLPFPFGLAQDVAHGLLMWPFCHQTVFWPSR